jgi:WD40 repeat protein
MNAMSRRRFTATVLGAAVLGTLADGCGSDGDPSGGEPKASSNVPRGTVNVLAYSGDGTTLLAGDDVGEVFSWDPASHAAASRRQVTEYPQAVHPSVGAIAVAADGSFLVAARMLEIWNAADLTRTAMLWSPQDGALRPAPPSWVGADSEGLRYSTAAAVSPDGTTVVDGLYGGTVRIWDRRSGRQAAELPGGTDLGLVNDVAFSYDGNRVAAAFAAPTGGVPQGATLIWDLASRRKIGSLDEASDGVLFRPDGGLCASTVQGVMFLDPSGAAQGAPFASSPRAVALSFDGAILALGNGPDAERIELWDVGAHRRIRAFKVSGSVTALAFAQSGRMLAVGTADGTMQEWDVSTG